jgi:hypothetical protein
LKRWLLSIKDEYKWYDIDEKEQLTFFTDKFAKKGDLTVIYKSSPLAYISHLFTVKDSSRYEYANSDKEKYQMEIYKKFELPQPISLNEMNENFVLEGWISRFPGFIYEMPADTWIKMMDFILEKNPGLIKPNTNQNNTNHQKIHDYMNIGHVLDLVNSCILKSDNSECCRIPPNEASTEGMIIRPILRYLGWNTSNPCEVRQEFSIGRKKVDYALRCDNSNKLFIEVKNFNEDLKPENENQLIDYCDLDDVNLGLLTNGKIWQFYYLTYGKSNYVSSREMICEIDVLNDDKKKAIETFSQLLSKEAIKSGNAISFAQELSK